MQINANQGQSRPVKASLSTSRPIKANQRHPMPIRTNQQWSEPIQLTRARPLGASKGPSSNTELERHVTLLANQRQFWGTVNKRKLPEWLTGQPDCTKAFQCQLEPKRYNQGHPRPSKSNQGQSRTIKASQGQGKSGQMMANQCQYNHKSEPIKATQSLHGETIWRPMANPLTNKGPSKTQ